MAEGTQRTFGSAPWLVALVAAVVAASVRIPRTDEGGKSDKSAATTAVAADAAKTDDESVDSEAGSPLDVLRLHLHPQARESSDGASAKFVVKANGATHVLNYSEKAGAKSSPPLRDELRRDPAEYDVLIATVPDPIETKLPHEFDATVDSIQRAFESMGYTLRASWLPWPRDQNRNDSRAKANPPHRSKPGVLLFRKSGYGDDKNYDPACDKKPEDGAPRNRRATSGDRQSPSSFWSAKVRSPAFIRRRSPRPWRCERS